MNEIVLCGIGVMLVCFGIATYFLSRIPADVFSTEYNTKLDPFLPIFGTMLLGGIGVFLLFNNQFDTIKDYGLVDFILPFIFGGVIYFCYLLDIKFITDIVILICSLIMAFVQPDDFSLDLNGLTIWQEKIIVAVVMYIVAKGLSLLNGLAGIATMQFIAFCAVLVGIAYFGAVPLILAYVAIAYFGVMLAFISFSWPPEKLVITNGGWCAIGFVLASLMLYGSVEHSEVSVIIATSYLFTEVGIAIYNKVILNTDKELPYMYTSYYDISNEGEYENYVVVGVAKIFFIDALLAIFQVFAQERIALFVFSVALNMWFLQVLRGEAEPVGFFSVTKWGLKKVKHIFNGDNTEEEVSQDNNATVKDIKKKTEKSVKSTKKVGASKKATNNEKKVRTAKKAKSTENSKKSKVK